MPTREPLKLYHCGQGDGRAMSGYVRGVFNHFFHRRGVRVDWPPKEADVILYTVYYPTDLIRLRKLRRMYPGKLIITGGIEAFNPGYLLSFSDASCVGEGFEFMEKAPLNKGVNGLRRWMEEQPWMATPEKAGTEIVPNTHIPWPEIPVLRLSPNCYYYLAAKGCRNKCLFCFTSWMNPYAANPLSGRPQLEDMIKREKRNITFVGNDTGDLDLPHGLRSPASVSVRNFLRRPTIYAKRSMLHVGIEGWTEKMRKWYGKPVSNEEIRALFNVTKNLKLQFEMFMITHQPYDMDEFISRALPYDTAVYPRVFAKLTPLEPIPGTPLENYDLSVEEEAITRDSAFSAFITVNRRIRVYPMMSLQKAHTSALLRRMGIGDANRVLESSVHWDSLTDWRKYLKDNGLWEAYCGSYERPFKIRHPHPFYARVKEQKIAEAKAWTNSV